MAKQNYIALTIGPIYRTLASLRRTRAIFAGSYLFSWVMRELLRHLTEGENKLQGQLLIPYVPTPETERQKYLKPQKKVGLFPDRILAEAAGNDFEKLQNACTEVLKQMQGILNPDPNDKHDLTVSPMFIQQYFQLYGLKVTLEKGEHTINTLNQLLDNLELQNQLIDGPDPDELTCYLAKPKLFRTAGSLMYDALGENPAFPSVWELAARGLRQYDPNAFDKIVKDARQQTNAEEDKLMSEFQKEFASHFRQHHKYMAIVQADGDRMGKRIGSLDADVSKLGSLSKQLYDFGQKAQKVISSYGGTPVYIGGDDLFFFAPVAVPDQLKSHTNTIFDCINQLDDAFHSIFGREQGGPTMSYGISVAYHKFPLNEARAEAYDLLMHKAKKETLHPQKNAVEIKVLKHSGAYFDWGIDKGTNYANTADDLLKTSLTDESWLNSVIYFVQYWQHVFPRLGLNELKNLFYNRLDEAIHRNNAGFLYEQLPTFIYEVYHPKPASGDEQAETQFEQGAPKTILDSDQTTTETERAIQTDPKSAAARIFGLLRFIQFIRSSSKDEQTGL